MSPGWIGLRSSPHLAQARELVERLRQIVTVLGDCPVAWELAEAAADLERLVFALEA